MVIRLKVKRNVDKVRWLPHVTRAVFTTSHYGARRSPVSN